MNDDGLLVERLAAIATAAEAPLPPRGHWQRVSELIPHSPPCRSPSSTLNVVHGVEVTFPILVVARTPSQQCLASPGVPRGQHQPRRARELELQNGAT